MVVEIQRIYEDDSKRRHDVKGESFRIFVDMLWARGINKKEASIDLWLKDIAPSDKLRKWYGHDPRKWNEFKKRYFRAGRQQGISRANFAKIALRLFCILALWHKG